MNALDVVSLDEAKLFLRCDFSDDDDLIEALIKSAVNLVEQLTNYRLYQRNEIIILNAVGYECFQYPLNNVSVVNIDSADVNVYTVQNRYGATRISLFWGRGFQYTGYNESFFNPDFYLISGPPVNYQLTLDVGYTDTTLIPDDLITALKQIIVFTYENRDSAKVDMPDNIQMLLTNYRRFATIY